MRTKIISFILLALAILVVAIITRPDHFKITRSAVISAPPQAVFARVNDYHQWAAWSPWTKLDPQAKNTFAGPESGVGASLAWSGNSDIGEGKQTITESTPGERVRMKLEFVRPFPGTSDVEFTFQPEASGTRVTWTMSGQADFMSKAISLVMDCDKMVGGSFEEGLANLKRVVETAPKS